MTRTAVKFGVAGSGGGHLTKQQFVYSTLRESILRCELAPGTRLVIDDLAKQFRVSIIPVREALRLLQSEGLVLSTAHVGATVAGPVVVVIPISWTTAAATSAAMSVCTNTCVLESRRRYVPAQAVVASDVRVSVATTRTSSRSIRTGSRNECRD